MHLGTTVWVERLQMMVRQPSIASYVAKFDSAQDLVNEGKIYQYLVDQKQTQGKVFNIRLFPCHCNQVKSLLELGNPRLLTLYL